MLIENRLLAGYPLPVKVSLAGGFERGCISVAGHAFERGPGGWAARRVFLPAPDVEVAVQIIAAEPAEYAFSVAINGRTVRERGTAPAGKTRVVRSYPFARFGLDPARPPAEECAAPRRGRPAREAPWWLTGLGGGRRGAAMTR